MSKAPALVILAAALTGCGGSGPGRPAPVRQGSGYADPAACRPCHADIARSYESVAMARSFANPANQTNTVHPFLALGVERTEEPSWDDSEEIRVILADYLGVMARLYRGEV